MRRKNIQDFIRVELSGMSDPVSFSRVELDYVPPLDAGEWSTNPLAPFASVRWVNDSESAPTSDTPGVWNGSLAIDLVNVSGFDDRWRMVAAVNDAVDAVIDLFESDPSLSGRCVHSWVASVMEKPTDVTSQWVVKRCQVMVSVQSEPGVPSVEE